MILERLLLKDFRSYKEKEILFSDKVNILVGKNAQGKTNILEAIFFLCLGKSFRTPREKEVVNWSAENGGYVKGEFKKKYRDIEVEMFFNKDRKRQSKLMGLVYERLVNCLAV